MQGRRKETKIFHVNMLQKWNAPVCIGFLSVVVGEEVEGEIPSWKDDQQGEAKVGSQLSSAQQQELMDLLGKFQAVFQTLPGNTALAEHRIQTEDHETPVRLPPYRIPHAYREAVREELREMLKHGVIERSRSDWASPLVTVRKKDGSLRLCVDYRRLNGLSKADAYPIPRVETTS